MSSRSRRIDSNGLSPSRWYGAMKVPNVSLAGTSSPCSTMGSQLHAVHEGTGRLVALGRLRHQSAPLLARLLRQRRRRVRVTGPAVNEEEGAGDVAGVGPAQERHHAGDVVGRPDAADGPAPLHHGPQLPT